MVDYIGSEAVKKYYKEKGIILSDRMIAARICNAGFNVNEIHSSLREVQAQTKDDGLKVQIEKYIGRELDMYEKMKKSVPGDIYKLSIWCEGDEGYIENGYSRDFETAFLAAREIKARKKDVDRYKIEKFRIMDKSQFPLAEEYWSIRDANGCAEYDEEEELYYIWIRMEEEEEWERLFDEEYYCYPHPFKRGDILVRRGDDDTLYVMDLPPETEARREKKISQWGDFSDIGISATMFDRRTGRIWDMDERVHPFDFEYAPIDEKTEDIIERAALEMQQILQGNLGSFQYIYDACARRQEDYLESSRISLITGIKLHPHNVLL